jgi:hypothetical protein
MQAMALSVGLGGNLTANASASISSALLEQAGSNGFHPTCGLVSCRHILQGLTLANASAALIMATHVSNAGVLIVMPAAAQDVHIHIHTYTHMHCRSILQVDSPSWGYMSTSDMPGTIWEQWGGDAHTSDGM